MLLLKTLGIPDQGLKLNRGVVVDGAAHKKTGESKFAASSALACSSKLISQRLFSIALCWSVWQGGTSTGRMILSLRLFQAICCARQGTGSTLPGSIITWGRVDDAALHPVWFGQFGASTHPPMANILVSWWNDFRPILYYTRHQSIFLHFFPNMNKL